MAVLARTNVQLERIETALKVLDVPSVRLGADHSPASDLAAGEAPTRWQHDEVPDAVALSTIHRAKGLEWRHVAVIGFAEGLIPHYNATDDDDLAEERRLAYVALTRPESSLLITWSRGRDDPRRPERVASRFLRPVESALRALEAEQAPIGAEATKSRVAAIKAQLEAARSKVALPDSGPRRTSR